MLNQSKLEHVGRIVEKQMMVASFSLTLRQIDFISICTTSIFFISELNMQLLLNNNIVTLILLSGLFCCFICSSHFDFARKNSKLAKNFIVADCLKLN
ncbi:hypothetical protein T4D_8288 [Trichinella pseudospiralis]|uniref:Uncharacterized protein n=1 Tax=Trichinella pseudospiralis TaxID=6337 RepID=A0A0V1G6S6_TRIPS|nr:hypothetical protein T4D_8288 [Trichinella pseudospiralis]